MLIFPTHIYCNIEVQYILYYIISYHITFFGTLGLHLSVNICNMCIYIYIHMHLYIIYVYVYVHMYICTYMLQIYILERNRCFIIEIQYFHNLNINGIVKNKVQFLRSIWNLVKSTFLSLFFSEGLLLQILTAFK